MAQPPTEGDVVNIPRKFRAASVFAFLYTDVMAAINGLALVAFTFFTSYIPPVVQRLLYLFGFGLFYTVVDLLLGHALPVATLVRSHRSKR